MISIFTCGDDNNDYMRVELCHEPCGERVGFEIKLSENPELCGPMVYLTKSQVEDLHKFLKMLIKGD